MTLFNIHKNELVYPEVDYVHYWTNKWGISVKQLNDAIIETGSIDVKKIKNNLVEKRILFSIVGLVNEIGNINYLKVFKSILVKNFKTNRRVV